MKALLVIDAQNGIVTKKDFSSVLHSIKQLISIFTSRKEPVFFLLQEDEQGNGDLVPGN
ncbi:hypothetical protein EI42_06392 [Thermosporothrix hazakensis]|jgi:nicotinamidase-related amidase|uniref:Isochorismatase family protein n=1 Tax=Thermosporothrix hazakensis TaxID=644383 RepID=A0A326TQD9_THEHA|nr:hypothetical protein [Thermosporothrix hazakensis]PZW18044.1 hypothetical protein EI42_06392 [Thermosporothrix hazakensis]GCE46324.1 hypothetical protein KTH_11930 [Thermosporothrix hazakensis]GCE46337.1 hypothetical protein KTH_12060 [Thermosporothrix hazakensis]GCE50752.1 hypothetical protein KTH_56210 [Thermosporothrix hazakensis]